MPDNIKDQPDSDLWISLDEAVLRSGVSKRNIQEWVRSGQVKREKRRGKIFVWVRDLVTLTPLTQKEEVETEELPVMTTEILPPSAGELSQGASASLRLVGEQLRKNSENQENMLTRMDEIQGVLSQVNDMDRLDPRTIKELSLLGNVFRSIHQNGEKVAEALKTQELMLKGLGEESAKKEELQKEVHDLEKKSDRGYWVAALISVVVLAISGVLYLMMSQEQQKLENNILSQNEEIELKEGEIKVAKNEISKKEDEKLELERQKQAEFIAAQDKYANDLTLLMEKQALEKEKIRQDFQKQKQTEVQEAKALFEKRESELSQNMATQLKAQDENLKAMELRHKEELSRLEDLNAAYLSALGQQTQAIKKAISEIQPSTEASLLEIKDSPAVRETLRP
ncbi:MAG: hypothetical protein HQL32_06420 [Planctomycetes bacterium]|nr:hypothetical protein [Planctomycetota bacterium]